ncbi:MAG TPA: hypothetical protein VN698_16080 [Bacteroidia bacterium]|nr:hypothetical protein [Bacteroidia bacterium]
MKLVKASKILHVIVLLCCFLPAIIPTCGGPTKAEIEAREKTVQDSISQVTVADTLKINASDSALAKTDTSLVDTTAIVNNADKVKTDTATVESETDTIKTIKPEKPTWQKAFSLLIFPDNDNLSIVGYTLFGFVASCPVIFLFMLLWSALLRFTNNNYKLIFIQTLLGQIVLTIYILNNYEDLLWGYWVVYALSLFNAILNWWIYFTVKRDKQINAWGDL